MARSGVLATAVKRGAVALQESGRSGNATQRTPRLHRRPRTDGVVLPQPRTPHPRRSHSSDGAGERTRSLHQECAPLPDDRRSSGAAAVLRDRASLRRHCALGGRCRSRPRSDGASGARSEARRSRAETEHAAAQCVSVALTQCIVPILDGVLCLSLLALALSEVRGLCVCLSGSSLATLFRWRHGRGRRPEREPVKGGRLVDREPHWLDETRLPNAVRDVRAHVVAVMRLPVLIYDP